MRTQTRRARELRRRATAAERHLWQRLRARQLDGAKFRRQVPIGPYIVDFACLSSRIVIELDGGQHAEREHSRRDKRRDRFLEARGFRVLRFWDNDVFTDMDGILSVIRDALAASSPHPNPLPEGEGKSRCISPKGVWMYFSRSVKDPLPRSRGRLGGGGKDPSP